jgi:mono/diheme cytochrome c family protein
MMRIDVMTQPARKAHTFALTVCLALAVLAAPAVQAEPSDGTFSSNRRFVPKDGDVLYRSICQGCHMPDGMGAVGAGMYPRLAGNERLQNAGYPVFIVINGLRGMPAFSTYLDDQQVAAVVNYVRTHFGNDYTDEVSPDTVKNVRQSHCRPERRNLSRDASLSLPARSRCSPR